MIYENNRSIFHCPKCGKILSRVSCFYHGAEGDEQIDRVMGHCKTHGLVESKTDWIWEEFFPEPS